MTRRWQRRREEVGHIDDWLMTYADMITLLLCFFAIFLSISMSKKDAPQTVPSPPPMAQPAPPPPAPSAAAAPAPPFPARAGEPADHHADEALPQPIAAAVATPPDTAARPVPAANAAAADQPAAPPAVASPPPPAPSTAAAKPAATLPQIVGRLKSHGAAALEQKGDRITTLEMNSAAFFDRGSATLSEAGKSVLKDVAVAVQSDKFKDYHVTVEGHTDDTPIHTAQFPSNWELSTARAASVVRFFLDQGIPARRLSAAGYADTFPKAPNRDAAGNPIPANQALNRRVVIKLEKIDKTQ